MILLLNLIALMDWLYFKKKRIMSTLSWDQVVICIIVIVIIIITIFTIIIIYLLPSDWFIE